MVIRDADPLGFDPECWLRAARFAGAAHEGQAYEGLPYLFHLTAVAMEVSRAIVPDGLEGDIAISCALLHDTVEDTRVTPEEIAAEFGEAIAAGVIALTKDESLPTKAEAMRDSVERLLLQPPSVQAVKIADRVINLCDAPERWSTRKRMRYADEAEMILDRLGGSSAVLAARLAQQIAGYRRRFG